MSDEFSKKSLYEQGSKCCQNYSDLTMKLRTLAQQVFLTYVVGLGLLTTKIVDHPYLFSAITFPAGLILVRFGSVSSILNRHYSLAFEAIRDKSLAILEREVLGDSEKVVGPWEAHRNHRIDDQDKFKAWDGPFAAVQLLGVVVALLGALVAAVTYFDF